MDANTTCITLPFFYLSVKGKQTNNFILLLIKLITVPRCIKHSNWMLLIGWVVNCYNHDACLSLSKIHETIEVITTLCTVCV